MNNAPRHLITGVALLLVGLSLVFALASSIMPRARAASNVRYAASRGLTDGSCDSWERACSLEYALLVAERGDEIWVRAGVHRPTTTDPDPRRAHFALERDVAVYGGFAGTEDALNQRNPAVNVTILSGDIDEDDINIDGNFIAESTSDIQGNNAYHVVIATNLDDTAVVHKCHSAGRSASVVDERYWLRFSS